MIYDRDKYTERALSRALGVSRVTLRKALRGQASVRLGTYQKIARYFKQQVELLCFPREHRPDASTVAIGFRICRDGTESWKIHLMNFVDEFRRSKDGRLIVLPPDSSCPQQIQALIAATVEELCREINIASPEWVHKVKFLERPWFVSGMESLKASALIESPLAFRAKNIFVQQNFLERH